MAEAEGRIFKVEDESRIRRDFLEVFEFDSERQLIEIKTKEFTAVCPFSGLPDYGQIIIQYYPEGKKCIELKSLKYYLTSFRNIGIYQEKVTKKIYSDLKKLLLTDRLQVVTIYNIRGGIETICTEGGL